MRELVEAGVDGWEAVGMAVTEDALLILVKREITAEEAKRDRERT